MPIRVVAILMGAPFTLQVSGIPSDVIFIAISPVE